MQSCVPFQFLIHSAAGFPQQLRGEDTVEESILGVITAAGFCYDDIGAKTSGGPEP